MFYVHSYRHTAHRTLTLLAVLLTLVGPARLYAQQDQPENRFEPQIQAFEEQDKRNPPPRNAILFVGSSSIRLWNLKESFPDMETINRGFGGSQLSDSVYFAERIILPYQPRTVVVYAGDNDIAAGKTPEQVLADFQALVTKIHAGLPRTKIVFICIKPSLARWALVDKMRQANKLIREFIATDNLLTYVDVDTPMIGEDGKPRPELLRADKLHLSPEGYKLWASILTPILKSLDEAEAKQAA